MENTRGIQGWRKSSSCASGACVEVAMHGDNFIVRDSKNPSGPALAFTPEEWHAFVQGVNAGEFTFTQ
jgi:predicted secreted Zn-dependent protease